VHKGTTAYVTLHHEEREKKKKGGKKARKRCARKKKANLHLNFRSSQTWGRRSVKPGKRKKKKKGKGVYLLWPNGEGTT